MSGGLKYLLALASVCILACGVHSQHVAVKDVPAFAVEYAGMQVKPDDGLTRLQLKLIGISHTAGRIDSVYVFGADRVGVAATDIDGVDFGRWFQWEDEPVIVIELDLPGVAYTGWETLTFYGPRGNVSCKIGSGK